MKFSTISDDALAGAFSGFMGRVITAPFDVVKIRQQLALSSAKPIHTMNVSSTFKKVIEEEGILALWKGNLSATILWVSYSAVQFSVYGTLKEAFQSVDNYRSWNEVSVLFVAGGISG